MIPIYTIFYLLQGRARRNVRATRHKTMRAFLMKVQEIPDGNELQCSVDMPVNKLSERKCSLNPKP